MKDIDGYGGYDDLFIVQKGWVSMSGLSKLKGLWKRRIAVLIAAVLIFEGTILPVSAATLSSATSSEQEQRIESIEGDSSILDDEQSMNSLSGNVISGNSDDEVSDNAGESALSMNDIVEYATQFDTGYDDPTFTLSLTQGNENADLYINEYGDYNLNVIAGQSVELSVSCADLENQDFSTLSLEEWEFEDYSVSVNTATGKIKIDTQKAGGLGGFIFLGNQRMYFSGYIYPVTDQFYFEENELIYYINENGDFVDEKGALVYEPVNYSRLDFGFGIVENDYLLEREYFEGQIVDISGNNENLRVNNDTGAGYYGYSITPLKEGETTVRAIYQNPVTKEQIVASVLVKIYKQVSCSHNNLKINHFVTNDELLGNLAIPVSSNDYKWKYPFMSMRKFSNTSTSSLPIESTLEIPYTVVGDGVVRTTINKIIKPVLGTNPIKETGFNKVTQTVETKDLILSGSYKNDMRVFARVPFYFNNRNSDYIFDYEYKELSKLGLVFDNMSSGDDLITPMGNILIKDSEKAGKAKVEIIQKVYRKKAFEFAETESDLYRGEVDFSKYELVSTISSQIGFNVVNKHRGLALTEYTFTDDDGDVITTFDEKFLEELQPGDVFSVSCNTVGYSNNAVVIKAKNPKILKVTQTDKNHATVQVQQCGNTKLVVLSKVNPVFSREVSVQVRDFTPIIMDKKVEINALKSDGVVLTIEKAYDQSFSNVVIQSIQSKKGSISSNSLVIHKLNANQYQITFDSGEIAKQFVNGTYTVSLAADYGEKVGQTIGSVVVTVVRKAPVVSIKQTQDVNGFYSNMVGGKLLYDEYLFNGKLKMVSQSGDISDYAVKNQAGEDYSIEYDFITDDDTDSVNHLYNIYPSSNKKAFVDMDREVTLLLQVEDYYEPVEKTVVIKTRNKAYKLELRDYWGRDGRTYFGKVESCEVRGYIYNATLNQSYEVYWKNDYEFVNLSGDDNFDVEKDDYGPLEVTIKNLKKVSSTCKFSMNSQSWSKPVIISYTFKVTNKSPKFKYLTSKIVLNDYYVYQNDQKPVEYLADETKIYLTTDYFEQEGRAYNVDVELKDAKGNDVEDNYDAIINYEYYKNKQVCSVRLRAKKKVNPGTYKIYLTPTFTVYGGEKNVTQGTEKEIILKVINKEPKLDVKFKGKLDVAKPYDYKQLEIVADLMDYSSEELSIDNLISGEDAYLFDLVCEEDLNYENATWKDRYYLVLKEPTYKLDSKKTYSVDFKVKYSIHYTKSDISEIVTLKFKPIETKSKLEPINKTYSISARKGNSGTVPIGLKWNEYVEESLQYGGRVELMNYTKEFTVDSDLLEGYQSDKLDKSLNLNLSIHEVSDLVVGKTYPLKFKITPNACALEGTSYTVTVNVKVVE